MESRFPLPILAVFLLLASACGELPKDPVGTTAELAQRPLRAGVAAAEPWVLVADGPVADGPVAAVSRRSGPGRRVAADRISGLEPALVSALAEELDVEVEWWTAGEGELLEALERYELDLVVGGLTASSAWKRRVGLTSAYLVSGAGERSHPHVWAVAPGENGFLMTVERFLADHRSEAQRAARRLGVEAPREPGR